jgi:hypothetical protein
MTSFRDTELLDWGSEILLAGAIYSAGDKNFACFFPGSSEEKAQPVVVLDMDAQDWTALIDQLDKLNVQVNFVNGSPERAIFSKSARAVDNNVSWAVYRRDNYTCRYCGDSQSPLSVDHLVLWEDGGPWTMDNLVTCCKRDNKKRGRMQYAAWLDSDYYKRISAGLTDEAKAANRALLPTLDGIRRLNHARSR